MSESKRCWSYGPSGRCELAQGHTGVHQRKAERWPWGKHAPFSQPQVGHTQLGSGAAPTPGPELAER